MVDDIDVRFGDNAVPSGYEDVQMRFEKNGNLYELLILPGPNYLAIKIKNTNWFMKISENMILL